MSKVHYDKRLSVSITRKMDELLDEIAVSRTRRNKPVSKADLMREALRLYLDQQPDARGSRKQIAKSLEGQMTQLFEQFTAFDHRVDRQTEALIDLYKLVEQLQTDLEPLIAMAKARKAK